MNPLTRKVNGSGKSLETVSGNSEDESAKTAEEPELRYRLNTAPSAEAI